MTSLLHYCLCSTALLLSVLCPSTPSHLMPPLRCCHPLTLPCSASTRSAHLALLQPTVAASPSPQALQEGCLRLWSQHPGTAPSLAAHVHHRVGCKPCPIACPCQRHPIKKPLLVPSTPTAFPCQISPASVPLLILPSLTACPCQHPPFNGPFQASLCPAPRPSHALLPRPHSRRAPHAPHAPMQPCITVL